MDEQGAARRKPGVRFTAARRARFLEVLAATGNRTAAAEAIGTCLETMKGRRRADPALAAAWDAALAEAERKLGGARHPFDGVEDGRFEVIQRGRSGKLQIMTVRAGRWTQEVEDRFIDVLRMCGNVAAGARAVGFSESAVWLRRRKWTAFARRMEEALEDAEIRLEFRLACIGSPVGQGPVQDEGEREPGSGTQAIDSDVSEEPFDREFALRFLKWREEKRRGGGRRGAAIAQPPSIEEVTERIVRKVEAIKRHRARDGA